MRVIQATWGQVPAPNQLCLDSVKEIYPQVEVFYFPSSNAPLYHSDKWRWEILQQYDDILYIDWDIQLTEPIEFEQNGRLSSIYYEGQPDNCLIYCPDKELICSLEAERIRRKIAFETFGWHRKIMRDKKVNEVIGIKHLRTSGMKQLIKQYGRLNV